MPSPRQFRLLGVLLFAFLFTVLWKTSTLRNSRNVDFYKSTSDAMAAANGNSAPYEPPPNGAKEKVLKAPGAKTPIDDDDDSVRASLKKAADEAKRLANEKAPLRPDNPNSVVGVGSANNGGDRNVAGRKKYPIEGEEQVVQNTENQEDHDVEIELNTILKRSPIIIFSKSYCPHSKRAKGILLDKYSIKPAPFVVELDEHPLGSALQARLAKMTGRKTVPNVLINGKSIGGGDDVAELDVRRELIDIVKSMGGKRMVEVIQRSS